MSGNLLAKKESESSSLQFAAGFLEEDGAIPTHTGTVLPHPIHPHSEHTGNQRCASSERDTAMAQCSDFQAVDMFVAPSNESVSPNRDCTSFQAGLPTRELLGAHCR